MVGVFVDHIGEGVDFVGDHGGAYPAKSAENKGEAEECGDDGEGSVADFEFGLDEAYEGIEEVGDEASGEEGEEDVGEAVEEPDEACGAGYCDDGPNETVAGPEYFGLCVHFVRIGGLDASFHLAHNQDVVLFIQRSHAKG